MLLTAGIALAAPAQAVCVDAIQGGRCEVDVSTGDTEAHVLAVSLGGHADTSFSCRGIPCGSAAVSVRGSTNADCSAGAVVCAAVAGRGPSTCSTWGACASIAGLFDADCGGRNTCLALSGTGDARTTCTGDVVVDEPRPCLAVAPFGDATASCEDADRCYAVSGTGEASGGNELSGCETGREHETDAACIRLPIPPDAGAMARANPR